MPFTKEQLDEMRTAYGDVRPTYERLLLTFTRHAFREERSREFAHHGFGRRVLLLSRCMFNIFAVCPPDRVEKPSREERADLMINLHAFAFNVFGALDNLAWVLTVERRIKDAAGHELKRTSIGLGPKCEALRGGLSQGFRDQLATFDAWFGQLEDFRHALAHRIPFYVPPFTANEQEHERLRAIEVERYAAISAHEFERADRLDEEEHAIGRFTPWITHSFGERAQIIYFHPQILADWATVRDIADATLRELGLP